MLSLFSDDEQKKKKKKKEEDDRRSFFCFSSLRSTPSFFARACRYEAIFFHG